MKKSWMTVILLIYLIFCQTYTVSGAGRESLKETKKFREAVNFYETWVESTLDLDRLPGMSIAVVHDQEIVYAKGFGYADTAKGIKAAAETGYNICSISKVFTGLAILQLRDEGKLSVDDPVSKYLPWFDPEVVDPEAPQPTLKDLLRHSGGLPCEPDLQIWDDPSKLSPTREELIDRVSRLKMKYRTNERHNYSNLGYALLGEIVTVVSGVEYSDYVEEKIFKPIGMDDTDLYEPDDDPAGRNAQGYGRWPREGSRVEIDPVPMERSMIPAGGFASTVIDIAEFAKWQFRVLDGMDTGVLKQETLKEMHEVHWENPSWGLGFTVWNMFGKTFVGHQGGCSGTGFKSQLIVSPEEKIAVVVMFNATDAPQFTAVFVGYEAFSPALTASADEEVGTEYGEWKDYTGYYTADRSWAEAEVLEWDGSLSVMWLPAYNPLNSLVKLRQVEQGVFRQVLNDGSLGKHYVFGADASGKIVSMKFNNNQLKKTVR